MNEGPPGRLGVALIRAVLIRAVLAGTVLAGTVLLAAGCGGDGTAATPQASTGQVSAATLDSFASCMRGHGVPDFYWSRTGSSAADSLTSVIQLGQWVAPADTSSPQFEAALKSCQHLLPMRPPTAAQLQQRLQQAVRQAACMRAHGYPDYPDPGTQDGHLVRPDLPAGIDTASPQFQTALEKCNAG